MVLSDHHPISITISFPTMPSRPTSWRLDNSLLNNPEHIKRINTCFSHYFQENESPDTNPMTLWAAHKCVIRGELISIAAKQRKARQARIAELSVSNHSLEKKHKQSLAEQTFQELLKAREDLLEELGKSTRCKYALSQHIFYEFGNKYGKLLARALQNKKANLTIHSISDPSGNKVETLTGIAHQFEQFYSKLYNLHTHPIPDPTPDRKQMIDLFLTQFGPQPGGGAAVCVEVCVADAHTYCCWLSSTFYLLTYPIET